MALRLVNDEERLVFEGDGFEIFYRRITSFKRSQIVARHTNRKGDPNNAAIGNEMLEWCITGWTGVEEVVDGEVRETPITPEAIKRIPDEVGAVLIELLGQNADAKAVEVKNLQSMSDNNTTIGVLPVEPVGRKPKKTTLSQ